LAAETDLWKRKDNAKTDEEQADLILAEVKLDLKKKVAIEKIADTLYKTEYSYLEYLNHLMGECDDSLRIEDGCPLDKCKAKHPMRLDDLRLHLRDECTKITLECNVCRLQMRRPQVQYHNCIHVFKNRLEERDKHIQAMVAREQQLQQVAHHYAPQQPALRPFIQQSSIQYQQARVNEINANLTKSRTGSLESFKRDAGLKSWKTKPKHARGTKDPA
jgi:hypothetical protein